MPSLSETFANHDAEDAAVRSDLATANALVARLETEINADVAQIAALTTQVQTDATTISGLQAHVADLEAQLAAASKPVVTTVFGADAERTDLAGQTAKVTKWGKGLAERQFFSPFTTVAPRSPDVKVLHASWKPGWNGKVFVLADALAALTPTAVKAAGAALPVGDSWEVIHEGNSKVSKGLISFEDLITIKNTFYDVAKSVRPDLNVVNTLTGWEANPNNSATGGNIDRWAVVKADLLGLDLDGVHGWPYPLYDGPIATAVAFCKKFPAYKGWCVPEFGTSRNTTNDPTGSVRAQWFTAYGTKAKVAGARYVCAYEYTDGVTNPTNPLTTTAEIAAWSALI